MHDITPDLVRQISERHLITTPVEPADLLFVFGTREGVDEFVAEIASLWGRRFFKHCIVSGGVTKGSEQSECEILKDRMVEAGIPADLILEEHHAMNTGENVLFSMPIIQQRLGLANIRTVIALGKICTSRRYLMTLQRHWPDVRKMLVAVNYFKTPRELWHIDQAFRERVLSEFAKIEPYKRAGFIVDWP